MVGLIREDTVQNYINAATGDRWEIRITEVLLRRRDHFDGIRVLVTARYQLPVTDVALESTLPWGTKEQRIYRILDEVLDSRTFIQMQRTCYSEDEARRARVELLRQVMDIIHQMDVLGQMPHEVRETLTEMNMSVKVEGQ